MLKKGLKSKAGLSRDFLSEALCHPSLYGLKSFKQVQSEGKLAALISFSNSSGVLEHLFEHSSVKSTCLSGVSVLDSEEFSTVVSRLYEVWSDLFKVFTDGSLKNFGGTDVANSTAAFFLAINMSISIKVHELLSSTMAELQVIALSLKCVLSSCTVVVHTDSQVAIDRYRIFDLVHEKDFSVHWVKVKGHSGVVDNVRADAAAGDAVFSHLFLPVGIWKHFLVAENILVFGNTHYFVRDLYRSVCCAQWEAEPGQNVIPNVLIEAVDWDATVKVHKEVLVMAFSDWLSVVGSCGLSSSAVLQSLDWCSLDVNLKEAVSAVVGFVGHLVELYHSKAWLARSVFRVRMEKTGLVRDNGLFSGLSRCLNSLLFDKVVRMFGIAGFFAVNFGCYRLYLFFSGLDGNPSVNISV
ncbi:hypothetical protein G9A89_005967 [Geosiphon pyriformis]|nr:hypothetical protein G9A89_005967 [Geosiphon pyriformis]